MVCFRRGTILFSLSVTADFYKQKNYVKVFITIILLSFIFKYYYRDSLTIIHYHTFSVWSDLMIGCLVSYLIYNKKEFEEFFHRISRNLIIPVYLFFAFLLLKRDFLFNNRFKVFESFIFAG